MRHNLLSLTLVALVLGLVACPKRTTRDLPDYQLGAGDLYLGGRVVDLYEHAVLNRRDFVYSIGFDPTSRLVAFSHMVLTDFELSLYNVEDGQLRWQVPLNPTEFDVEGVAFVGDRAVVLGCRRNSQSAHPGLRLHDLKTGANLASYYGDDERGYVQVGVSPDLRLVAGVTFKDGTLELHSADTLNWLGETRAHRGPATAVAFGPDGTLYTGGQDRSLAVWRLEPASLESAGQARMAKLIVGDAKQRAMVASFDGRANAIMALDTGVDATVITNSLATKLGLRAASERLPVRLGSTEIPAPRARVPSLRFKQLALTDVEVALCDECVPVGCDAAVGSDLLRRMRISDGPVPHVVTVEIGGRDAPTSIPASPGGIDGAPEEPSGAAGDVMDAAPQLLRPVLVRRHELPGSINDIRLSRDGARMVVAVSSEPAERSLELYEKEKAGKLPEPSAGNAALLIDAASGQVLKTFLSHRGYVVSADLSADGRTVVSGGWDNRVVLFDVESTQPVAEHAMAWLVRRVRFSPDGRTLAVGAWTPPASGGGESKPSAMLFDLVYETPERASTSKP
ncbi:MAG: aspartyl protease family protein [Pseudomonadota bacterium]